MARPEHEPTRQQKREAEALAGLGVPQDQIADLLGISEPTLRKHYAKELRLGVAKANSRVAKTLFEQAVGIRERVVEKPDGTRITEQVEVPPHIGAAIFWTKSRMGWREKVEVTGKDGGPIQHEHLHAEDSARERIRRRIDRLAAGLPLLPPSVERDVEETEATEDEA